MTVYKRMVFGQSVPRRQMRGMTRQIVGNIGNGEPAPVAGFVWFRPESLFQQNLLHYVERQPRAA